jgi:putative acetyltransferase
MRIRQEAPGDEAAIHALNVAAFETPAEAQLVDALRTQAEPFISMVAEDSGQIVGHILFTPVVPVKSPGNGLVGLAPMAVQPELQRQGIGRQLMQAGLDRCRHEGVLAVVVLGHPDYYPHFGFIPASRFDIQCAYDVPDEAFMAMELIPDSLQNVSGSIEYLPAFDLL